MGQKDMDFSKKLFDGSDLEISDEELELINIASQWPNAFVGSISTLYSSRLLMRALDNHAKALNKASEASDETARRMVYLTYVIAGVALLQVISLLFG